MTAVLADPAADAGRRTGRRTGLAMAVIGTAQLTVILDATIVDIALPSIQADLGFSTTTLSWVVNAYVLTFGALLLLGGRAGDLLGRRRVFVAGLTAFAVASMLGGLAVDAWMLIAARVVQGVAGALVAPAVLALVSTAFTTEKDKNRAFGVFAGASAAGSAIGLLAGGLLTEHLSWRWVLFVNVPICLVLALVTPLCIGETPRQRGSFDVAGAVVSALGMAALVYGFTRVNLDGWSAPTTLALFAAAAVLLTAFVFVERRARQPITPLHMFADRNKSGIYLIVLAMTGSFMGLFFFLTLFMQRVLGYGPVEAGLAFLPMTVAILAGAGLATNLLPKLGQRVFLLAGIAINGVAIAWLSQIDPSSGYVSGLLGPTLLFGVGNGFMFVPLTMIAVSGVREEEAGSASSLFDAVTQVGGALGLVILVTIFGTASRGVTGGPAAELTHGISTALLTGVGLIGFALVVAAVLIRPVPAESKPAA